MSKIWAWCDRKGFDDEVTDVMVHVIRTLDVQRAEAAAAEAARDKALGTGRGRGRR